MKSQLGRSLSSGLLQNDIPAPKINQYEADWKDYVLLLVVLMSVFSLAAYIFWFFCVRETGQSM